ncbi:hypothetical protein Tco_1295427 [Tanacetum coccineum]
MFILYCRRAAAKDSSLSMVINGLCAGLTARIEEREYFIDELDVLVDRFVLGKMAEILKETQEKDRNKMMRLQILGREFELRADEKNQFIEKLRGNLLCLVGEIRMDGVTLCVWDAGMSTLLDGFSTLYGSCLIAEIGLKWMCLEAEIVKCECLSRIKVTANGVTANGCGLCIHFSKSVNNGVVRDMWGVTVNYEFCPLGAYLDSLGVRHVPAKTAEFLREIQAKDKETIEKLRILQREMELNARKKDLFIENLKGVVPY